MLRKASLAVASTWAVLTAAGSNGPHSRMGLTWDTKRDVDGSGITEARRAICAERYNVTAEVRATRKRARTAQQLKKREGRGGKESTKAAPVRPTLCEAVPVAGAA